MSERETLWNACEAIERRKDSCVARELEVALPRELSLDAIIALVTGFVLEQLVSRGVVADVAIHQGPARDGGTNPHAHILFTTRPVLKDGSGFGKKDRGLERRETLAQWRAVLAGSRQPRPGRGRREPLASITAPSRSRAAPAPRADAEAAACWRWTERLARRQPCHRPADHRTAHRHGRVPGGRRPDDPAASAHPYLLTLASQALGQKG